MKKPLLIGVTGGIGSGKSLICKVFSILGIPVYNSDYWAKWLMNHDPVLKENIKSKFGPDSYTTSGGLNREFLAGEVFNKSDKVNILNGLVHPAVGKHFLKWTLENKKAPYLLKEAALIFESGANDGLDFVINVGVSEGERIKRVLKRDPFRSEEQIKNILARQLGEDERHRLADFTINNEDQLVIPQVLELHHKFIK